MNLEERLNKTLDMKASNDDRYNPYRGDIRASKYDDVGVCACMDCIKYEKCTYRKKMLLELANFVVGIRDKYSKHMGLGMSMSLYGHCNKYKGRG